MTFNSYEVELHDCALIICGYIYAMLRKTASLSVRWKTEGSPPVSLQDLLPGNPKATSALVHRHDCETDGLLQRAQRMTGENPTRMTLTVISPSENLAGLGLSPKKKSEQLKRQVLKDAFHFLQKEDFSMELGAECKDYIVVHTGPGKSFKSLNGKCEVLGKLEQHPMFTDIMGLSKIALKTFGCGDDFKTKGNAIYVALLYMDDTPAYYVGKASNGIKDRWCGSHCNDINQIIRCFEIAPGGFEQVVHHEPSHLALAGAVLKQVATRRVAGVALFAIDFCSKGKILCCNPGHNECTKEPKSIDHFEQHYISAFKKLFPDSDTEPKMMCLNAMESTLCHDCSAGNLRGCSVEVALSLLLHDLQLS